MEEHQGKKKNKSTLKDLWYIKHANIFIIGVSEGEKKEKRMENLFEEIVAENFPNLVKKIDVEVQKVQNYRQHELQKIHINTHSLNVKSQRENLKR